MARRLLSIILALSSSHCDCLAEQLAPGSGSYEFIDPEGNPDRPITVWYYRPQDFRTSDPVVFVMHGIDRNGRVYRDVWIKHAERRRFLLLVPEFSQRYYPTAKHYNWGFIFDDDGTIRDRSTWAFTAIERIFDEAVRDNNLKQELYTIYGHSAGAQFVHRFVTFLPDARVKLAIAANAGWYTKPQFDVDFPHGLAGTAVDEVSLKKSFAKRLIVLLGTKDTDPNHKHLTRTNGAMAQGPHRLARGRHYFSAGRETAKQLGADYRWRIRTVPGVGHSNSKMSEAAAKMIRKGGYLQGSQVPHPSR